jgi:glutamine transport system substrate-binding protein
MKKYLLMAMAVLAALSLIVAGCGGKEEAKKAEPAKVLRVGTEPTLHRLNSKKKALKNILVLIWTLSGPLANRWVTRLKS